MPEVSIRAAVHDDIESLCRLYHEFHQFHVRGVPDRLRSLGDVDSFDRSGLIKSLTEIINGEDTTIFVAAAGDRLIGLVEVYFRQDEQNPLRCEYKHGDIQSLMVTEKFRGQGTGRLLCEAAEAWAKAKGAVEVRLDIWEFTEGPLKFYERIGYKTLRRTIVRKL